MQARWITKSLAYLLSLGIKLNDSSTTSLNLLSKVGNEVDILRKVSFLVWKRKLMEVKEKRNSVGNEF